ncbi:hypothetical protein FE840_001425 [Peteryoungia desertarenae]|uniref:Helix-turn-helix domain-containing protein n=1 Tax=Peteryoungia desertarenae TaxID=1813451 RepID=A0ABX6QJP0_9HYPH|nr:helix-turn-helix domain-containing protein [Peteryoungia desertarenae]QLF68320.1 hypothetical protein FE840_001425 [Peteryoungia desertarenae]
MQVKTTEQKIYVATGKEMAAMLGVSPRRLQQLVSEGAVSGKIGRNQFNVSDVVVTFREHIRQK